MVNNRLLSLTIFRVYLNGNLILTNLIHFRWLRLAEIILYGNKKNIGTEYVSMETRLC